jgi:hypothetical protein
MSLSRPIQWYYSKADLIWLDGTFNAGLNFERFCSDFW